MLLQLLPTFLGLHQIVGDLAVLPPLCVHFPATAIGYIMRGTSESCLGNAARSTHLQYNWRVPTFFDLYGKVQ